MYIYIYIHNIKSLTADRPPFASERGTLQRNLLCKNAVQKTALKMLYKKCCTESAVQEMLYKECCTENPVQKMLYNKRCANNCVQK